MAHRRNDHLLPVDDDDDNILDFMPIEAMVWHHEDDDDDDIPPLLLRRRGPQEAEVQLVRREQPRLVRRVVGVAARMEDDIDERPPPLAPRRGGGPPRFAQNRFHRRPRMVVLPLQPPQQQQLQQQVRQHLAVAVPVMDEEEEEDDDDRDDDDQPEVLLLHNRPGMLDDQQLVELQLQRDERNVLMFRRGWNNANNNNATTGGDTTSTTTTAAEAPSPYLFDLIQQDLPCSSIIMDGTSVDVRGCHRVVQRCNQFPQEVLYHCPRTGRTPLHVAALRGACTHVIQTLWEPHPSARRLILPDRSGHNTPLHLFFMGLSRKRLSETEALARLELLLGPQEATRVSVVSAYNHDGYRPLHCACAVPSQMIYPSLIRRLLDLCSAAATWRTNKPKRQTPLQLYLQQLSRSRHRASFIENDDSADVVNVVSCLAERCPKFDCDEVNGWNVLHYAAKSCHAPVIRQLLNVYHEHDPNVGRIGTQHEHWTPLHILAQQDVAEHALSALEVLVNAAPSALTTCDTVSNSTPVHLLLRNKYKNKSQGMLAAQDTTTLRALQVMIQAMPSCLLINDTNRYVPLHVACDQGQDSSIVALLLEEYPEAAFLRTHKNDTALSLACATNQSLETIQLLLQINPSALVIPNHYGFLPLHCICRAYQPRLEIVRALVQANPTTLQTCTNNPHETPIHLASNNISASVGVVKAVTPSDALPSPRRFKSESGLSSDAIESTPLHLACFRGAPLETIESLAQSHPLWVTTRNNAGYTPLQVLCKNGHIEVDSIRLFAKLAGPTVFVDVDAMGNTPLHSAMRNGTDPQALISLLQSNPSALNMKTMYDDTALHVACLRGVHPDVIRQVVLTSTMSTSASRLHGTSTGLLSPLLVSNTAGQTPIGIAMEIFEHKCLNKCGSNCIEAKYDDQQQQAFDTLSTLVELLHYGPSLGPKATANIVGGDQPVPPCLLAASLSLHRIGVRLHPAFIRRVLHLRPNEARQLIDEHGNYPLHLEAGVPVEKMGLLNGPTPSSECDRCGTGCSNRLGLLRTLWELYPEAASSPNLFDDFPLTLMVQSGRPWDDTFALILQSHPPALHSLRHFDPRVLSPILLQRLYQRVGTDAVFNYLRSGASPMKGEQSPVVSTTGGAATAAAEATASGSVPAPAQRNSGSLRILPHFAKAWFVPKS